VLFDKFPGYAKIKIMIDAIWLIIYTLVSFVGSACLLRAWGNRIPGSLRSPLGMFVMAVTDWIVKPLRKALPSNKGIDWSSLAAAFVIALVLAVVYMLLHSAGKVPNFGAVVILALLWVLKWALYTAIGLLIIMAVLSWVNPNAPIAPAVNAWTQPILTPIRKFLPTVGGFDLSPLVAIVLIQAALLLLESSLPGVLKLAF
jgi:YggT family protein